MRLTDRLNLPQRIVLVVALALALGEIGTYLDSLDAAVRFGWFTYPESHPAGYSPGPSDWLPAWVHLIIWLVLIALWALPSIRVLRPFPEAPPKD